MCVFVCLCLCVCACGARARARVGRVRTFSDQACEVLHLKKHVYVFLEPEPRYWMVLVGSPVGPLAVVVARGGARAFAVAPGGQ